MTGLGDGAGSSRIDDVEHRLRVEPEEDDHDDERCQHGDLALAQVAESDLDGHRSVDGSGQHRPVVAGITVSVTGGDERISRVHLGLEHRVAPDRAGHGALEDPEHVDRGEHDADGGHDRPGRMSAEGADQHHELRDERVGARHGDGGQRADQEEAAEQRRHLPDPAVVADVSGAPAGGEHADDEEQQRRGQTVVDHVQHRAADRGRGEGEDTQRDEAEVRDRGVGDEPLEIALPGGDDRAVDDADDGQQ